MNTHQNLMLAVTILAAVHAILSGLILGNVFPLENKIFLPISIVVNIIIFVLSIICYNLKM
jgi:hypothetical protein